MSAGLHGVIPAAGIGARMAAELPKQYLQIDGRTLLEISAQTLLRVPGMASLTIALHPDDDRARGLPLLQDLRVRFTTGGKERADSVLAALLAIAGDEQGWVLVHDAARPGLPLAAVQRLIERVVSAGQGGILALPVVDTVKQADARGRIEATLERGRLWRAQTPQMFRLGELTRALQQAVASGQAVTDEASAMEMAGHAVQLVPGSAANLKVTVPEDLALASWYLGAGENTCV
ncbi:2-C-methyl-D-erythritol 4-phosphate cytidylyltransferase [Seongchinamella sediminis]|uniref:2-C-methyl-D-erythritol 4-phosphate cytidylyltransferase n=1 Tax=Seongchinamella sediminis TaxID=2283635 RepID=A0A3L7E235_9GAMM|nr:2-C-methyl-D-erythritol 4-phosphate cytidylyltransferase [Seongchinamella sediminis]RLQ22770.1 2-C-methyl-D-erythritol 4-phosphate cytidylyltransferase [Seongchinamella sediminis]